MNDTLHATCLLMLYIYIYSMYVYLMCVCPVFHWGWGEGSDGLFERKLAATASLLQSEGGYGENSGELKIYGLEGD